MIFKRGGSRCKIGSPDWHKFAASRQQICISVEVLLQRYAAPRLQRVSTKLIDVHQVQQVLRQQQWLEHQRHTLAMLIHIARALA
jgi:hypothetical protein